MSYGERLRQAREAKKMTQEQLATATGICASTISKMEKPGKGRKITIDEAVRLTQALGVSLEQLAGITDASIAHPHTTRAMQRLRESVFELEKALS